MDLKKNSKPAFGCSIGYNKMLKVLEIGVISFGPGREKTCLRKFVNKGADQPVHQRSLICAFIIRLMESIISRLATSKISIF